MNDKELSSASTTITMTFLKLIHEFNLNFYIDKRGNFIYEDPESKKAAIIVEGPPCNFATVYAVSIICWT